MKGLFRCRRHEMPELNTSSLPDLIFTVLFFFMIVTHMRDVERLVRYVLPTGSEIRKEEHKSSVVYIYIGHDNAKQPTVNSPFLIQLNNRLATIDDIRDFVNEERSRMNEEDRARMTVSIKADKDVPMGIIADVKKALQHSTALKISYSATEKAQEGSENSLLGTTEATQK